MMELLDSDGSIITDYASAPKEPRSLQDAGIAERSGEWIACDFPERPGAPNYHDCCLPCLLAAEADGQWMVPIMRERLERLGPMEDDR